MKLIKKPILKIVVNNVSDQHDPLVSDRVWEHVYNQLEDEVLSRVWDQVYNKVVIYN